MMIRVEKGETEAQYEQGIEKMMKNTNGRMEKPGMAETEQWIRNKEVEAVMVRDERVY